MRKNYLHLLEGVLFILPLLFASCGNGDNALEEIINGGGSGGGSSSANTYLKWNGTTLAETAIPDGATKMTSTTTSWSGTYIVDDNITIEADVTIAGDVDLIILDGKTLKINGKHLQEAATPSHKLSIYAQSEGDDKGKLIVNTTDDGDYPICAKDIDIHGGDINVSATGSDTQGIYSSNLFNIYGGKVTASGTMEGIMLNNSLTIYDGTIIVNAGATSGGQGGIAIEGTLIIEGGNVTATGGDGVSGGAGGEAINGTLTVNGGTLTATGGNGDGTYGGAGISGAATFNGGTITAKGIENSAINQNGAININDGITSVTLINTGATADPATSTNWIAFGTGALSFGGTDISMNWLTSFADPSASQQFGTTTIAVERAGTSLILTKYVP